MQDKRGMRYSDQQQQDRARRRQIRNWLILIAVIVAAVLVFRLLQQVGGINEVSATRLPCTADQQVTVFGDSVLYYDGVSIHCVSPTGSIKWTFSVGSDAAFSVSDTNLVIWSGTQLFIVDSSGRPSYNENMPDTVQFARVGSRYCAVVIGDDTDPELIIKNLDGTQVDDEIDAFSGLMLMDVGFYGEADQYMWTLAMDVYGVAVNTVLNTFQVGKMNTGVVNLGEYLAYRVLFEDGRLRVFTTQQMYTYDYKAVQDLNRTELVYGWQLVDASIPERGAANMLLAPTSQMTASMSMTELRVLTDSLDRRFTLPTACVGAAISGSNLYAVAPDTLYRADVTAQRFSAYPLNLPNGAFATSVVGVTKNGRAVVLSNDQVYAITLPR